MLVKPCPLFTTNMSISLTVVKAGFQIQWYHHTSFSRSGVLLLLLDYRLRLSHHRQVTPTTWIKAPKCVYTIKNNKNRNHCVCLGCQTMQTRTKFIYPSSPLLSITLVTTRLKTMLKATINNTFEFKKYSIKNMSIVN